MADRIKILVQKRTSLKSQITNFVNILDKGNADNSLKLRMARLKDLYHAYEEYNDELVGLDPNDVRLTEFVNIQDHFYAVAGRIENILNATDATDAHSSISSDNTQIDNTRSVDSVKKRRIKLPESSLPTFNGKLAVFQKRV